MLRGCIRRLATGKTLEVLLKQTQVTAHVKEA
jgi:hypothetical protein